MIELENKLDKTPLEELTAKDLDMEICEKLEKDINKLDIAYQKWKLQKEIKGLDWTKEFKVYWLSELNKIKDADDIKQLTNLNTFNINLQNFKNSHAKRLEKAKEDQQKNDNIIDGLLSSHRDIVDMRSNLDQYDKGSIYKFLEGRAAYYKTIKEGYLLLDSEFEVTSTSDNLNTWKLKEKAYRNKLSGLSFESTKHQANVLKKEKSKLEEKLHNDLNAANDVDPGDRKEKRQEAWDNYFKGIDDLVTPQPNKK